MVEDVRALEHFIVHRLSKIRGVGNIRVLPLSTPTAATSMVL
jgi:hypothetical protein